MFILHRMKNFIMLIIIFSLLLCFTGCIDITSEITLNQDGSASQAYKFSNIFGDMTGELTKYFDDSWQCDSYSKNGVYVTSFHKSASSLEQLNLYDQSQQISLTSDPLGLTCWFKEKIILSEQDRQTVALSGSILNYRIIFNSPFRITYTTGSLLGTNRVEWKLGMQDVSKEQIELVARMERCPNATKQKQSRLKIDLITKRIENKNINEKFKIYGKVINDKGNGMPDVKISVEDNLRKFSTYVTSSFGGYLEYPESDYLFSPEKGTFGFAFFTEIDNTECCTINIDYFIPTNLDHIKDLHFNHPILFPFDDLTESEQELIQYKYDVDLRGMGSATEDKMKYLEGTYLWGKKIGFGPPVDPWTILSYSVYGGICISGTYATGGTGAVFACAPLVGKTYKDALNAIADSLFRLGKINEITRNNLKASSHFVGTFIALVYNPNVDRKFIDMVKYVNEILGGLFDLANVEEDVEISENNETMYPFNILW